MPSRPRRDPPAKSRSRRAKPSASSQDSGYKLLFSHSRVVRDLITGHLDPAVAAACDLDSLEPVPGSYVTRDMRKRHSDVVWRVRCGKEWTYLYLLFEFQSTVDRFMALRMLLYVALLWQDLIRRKELVDDRLLPPVLPIVLYNGNERWTAPVDLGQLVAKPLPVLRKHLPSLRYLFLDQNHLPVMKGEEHWRNVFSLVSALEQADDDRAHLPILDAVRLAVQADPELDRSFSQFYVQVMAPANLPELPTLTHPTLQRISAMMATRFINSVQRRIAEGKAEGEAKGKAEGMVNAILDLVADGDLSAARAKLRLNVLADQRMITPDQLTKALSRLASR